MKKTLRLLSPNKIIIAAAISSVFSANVYATCSANATSISVSCTDYVVTTDIAAPGTVAVSAAITGTGQYSALLTNTGNVTNFNINTSGSISGGTIAALNNGGVIDTLTVAAGTNITGSAGKSGIRNSYVSGSTIYSGYINNLNINGSVTTAGGGIGINNTNSGGTINNIVIAGSGSVGGTASIDNSGTISTINNAGTLSGAIQNSGSGTIGTIDNSGTINNRIYNDNTITTLTNTGSINNSGTEGIYLGDGSGGRTGTITTLTNSGLIQGATAGIKMMGGSQITTLTNTATTYTANVSGISSIQLANTATIYTLNNAQNNLSYNGNLPWNYNIIVAGTNYAKMGVSNAASSTTTFGIYPGSSFSIGQNTYSSVLSGVTMSNITGATSGTYGGGLFRTNWNLAANTSNPNQLDLSANTQAQTPNTGTTSGNNLGGAIITAASAAGATTTMLSNGSNLASAAQALTQQQSDQLSNVHAEGYSSNMTIGLEQMAHITNTVMDRIHNPLSARSGTSTAYEMDQGKYVWVDAAAVKGTVNSYAGLAGFGYNLYDMVLGSDVYRDSTGGIGVYGGAGYTSMNEPAQVSQNFNTTNYYAGLYGGKYLPYNFKLSGALGYMYGNTNASRNNPNVGMFTGGTANSNYNTNGAYGAFKFSRPFQATQNLTLTPYIGASYSQLWMGQARESGGNDFNYTISNATAYTTVTFIGGEFIVPLTGAVKNPLSVVGFYRFGYDWFANSGYAHSVTANSRIFGSFNQVGADMGPALNLGGLGLQGYITQKLSARAGVVGSANTNGWQVGVGGELKWEM